MVWPRPGIAALMLCVAMALLAASSSSRAAAPVASPPFKAIKTRADLQREVAAAIAARRALLVWVRAEWALAALEMERRTLNDPDVAQAASGLVLLRADVTNFDSEDKLLLAALDLSGAPAVLFYGADGTEQRNFRVLGFMKATAFAAMIRAASAKAPGNKQ